MLDFFKCPVLRTSGYLVAEGCQVWRRLLSDGSDLCRRNQSENILNRGGGVDPELIPEHVVWGFDGLQERKRTQTSVCVCVFDMMRKPPLQLWLCDLSAAKHIKWKQYATFISLWLCWWEGTIFPFCFMAHRKHNQRSTSLSKLFTYSSTFNSLSSNWMN